MIAGTNANCKILKVNVSQTTATITLLIFATQATLPAKSFKIAIKDTDTSTLEYPDNNLYWIDQTNNYNNDSNNVDTKKYKEIMVNIDITRKNTAKIQDTQWIRTCYIYLIDSEKDINDTPAWSSEELNLISDSFDIPSVSNLIMNSTKDNHIKVLFGLKYRSEEDFNYNNKNINVLVNIRSLTTDSLIESHQVALSNTLSFEVTSTNTFDIGLPVVIQILVISLTNKILVEERRLFKPVHKYSNTYIKTATGVKKVIAYYINTDSKVEHEGGWL